MKVLFKSRARLGDAVLCFPSALFMKQQGHEVWVECPERWHPIFRWISYARPCAPGSCKDASVAFDTNKLDMTQCSAKIINYIQDAFPQLKGAPRDQRPFFDVDHKPSLPKLPSEYVIAAPFGYSQHFKVDPEWMIKKARSIFPDAPVICLSDVPRPALSAEILVSNSVDQLPAILRGAKAIFTINSAPTILAAAVNRHCFLVPNRDPIGGRTNYYVPDQTILQYP